MPLSVSVRITGVTTFEAFLLQPRLSTKAGFLIGHLRAGQFLPDESWRLQGIQMQVTARRRLTDGLNDGPTD